MFKVKIIFSRVKVNLPEQNIQGEAHIFKAEGQKVKITLQCTGHM